MGSFAAGAVVAASVLVTTQLVSGQTSAGETVFVPVVPCRLVDTRPASNVGPRSVPLGASGEQTFGAHDGSDADSACAIPSTATAVSTNVTAVGATAPSFLVLWPADSERPGTSNLNYFPGAPPTPNSVVVPLSGTGQFTAFNLNGTVDVIVDVNGYYQPSTSVGSTGPAGPAGPAGPPGSDAPGRRAFGRTLVGVKTLDTPGENLIIGRSSIDSSLAIDAFGNPIISYYDWSNGDLNVASCGNPTCTDVTVTALDTLNDVGRHSSIAIGPNGFPSISYQDVTSGNLKVATCSDQTCTSTAFRSTVDADGDVGSHTSITIGADGNPVVTYIAETDDELRIAVCTDPFCIGSSRSVADRMPGFVSGQATSVTIGTDGRPVFSYFTSDGSDLRFGVCRDAACATGLSTRRVDGTGVVGLHSSVTIGTDGNPVISYLDSSTDALKIARCADAECRDATIRVIDSSASVGSDTSITIGTDGNPVIAYRDVTNEDLKLATCGDPACTSATITKVDTIGDVGYDTSIAIGVHGDPMISYYDDTDLTLKIATVTGTSFTQGTWES